MPLTKNFADVIRAKLPADPARAEELLNCCLEEVGTLAMELDECRTENAALQTLAQRAYPGLKPSGFCSRGHRGEPLPVDCTICYPDLRSLQVAHAKVYEGLYQRVLAAAGVADPPNGRFGWDPAMQIVRDKLADLAECRRLLEEQAKRCSRCKGSGWQDWNEESAHGCEPCRQCQPIRNYLARGEADAN